MKASFIVLASFLLLFTSFKDAKKELRYDGIYYSIEKPSMFRTVQILRFYPDGEMVNQTFLAASYFKISEFDASYTNRLNENPIAYSLEDGIADFTISNRRYNGEVSSKGITCTIEETDDQGKVTSVEKEFTFLNVKGLDANLVHEKDE